MSGVIRTISQKIISNKHTLRLDYFPLTFRDRPALIRFRPVIGWAFRVYPSFRFLKSLFVTSHQFRHFSFRKRRVSVYITVRADIVEYPSLIMSFHFKSNSRIREYIVNNITVRLVGKNFRSCQTQLLVLDDDATSSKYRLQLIL